MASWAGIVLPFGAQFIYSEFFCHYSLLPSFVFIFLLMMPAMIWRLRKSYLASVAASVGLFFWVVWENHIQCVSDKGPFVGGLGPLYLLVLGLFTSLVLGWVFGWLDRRFLMKNTTP